MLRSLQSLVIYLPYLPRTGSRSGTTSDGGSRSRSC